jgi:acyl-CoA-binding protein
VAADGETERKIDPKTEAVLEFKRPGRPTPALSSPDHCFQPGIIMSDLQARFDQAQIDVKGLSERPANMTLLRLYALYKQGAEGDAHGDKPGFTDIVGRYKFEAWEGLKGTSQDEAKQKYIDLVEELKSGATT